MQRVAVAVFGVSVEGGNAQSDASAAATNSPKVVETYVNTYQMFKTRQLRLLFSFQSILTKDPQHTITKDTRITTGVSVICLI